jgi:hypothetical protein
MSRRVLCPTFLVGLVATVEGIHIGGDNNPILRRIHVD